MDLSRWERKEHFEHYLRTSRCSYSLTVDIDVTNLLDVVKSKGLKTYPAQIYMITTVVNQFREFRMSFDEQGNLGYWEMSNPLYTVLNRETETFSAIWTTYDSNFESFYTSCIMDIDQYATGKFSPQNGTPPNICSISSIPWLDFTAFNLNVYSEGDYLLPVFTIGKYTKSNGQTMMPLAIQVNHAVCDGLHAGRFVETLRGMASNPNRWLL